ncbi:alpha-ribazole phosphatase [Ureibacillus xyleni]|uniref:Alpha-ribazole phosphatase n=1 Tax=Ureibacillus xyleni TaxID=614648 RepID=A0A285TFX0_9BACL|nr:histidine phosphatase family protein [Ureibacillus xyleni]SOC20973.1 alpha-ribazole phosphatase [Ureibacillus xyleni]
MGDSVIVHLIRHEKTEANRLKKYVGWTDEPIIKNSQPLQLPFQPNIVYGSDLNRCAETAKLYFPNAQFKALFPLRELNFGEFEMKTYEQLKNLPIYREWIDYPEEITPPNGENFRHFTYRVTQCFRQIVVKPTTYTFVVHGGVIRLLLSLFGPSEKSFQEIAVNHRTIYTLKWPDTTSIKGGLRCESLLVEPIMEKENM